MADDLNTLPGEDTGKKGAGAKIKTAKESNKTATKKITGNPLLDGFNTGGGIEPEEEKVETPIEEIKEEIVQEEKIETENKTIEEEKEMAKNTGVEATIAAMGAMPVAKGLGRKFIVGKEFTLTEVKEFILSKLSYNGKAAIEMINPTAIIQALVNKYGDIGLAKQVYGKLTVEEKIPFIVKLQLDATDFMSKPSASVNPLAIMGEVKVVDEAKLRTAVGSVSPTIKGAFVYPYIYSDNKIEVFVDFTKIAVDLLKETDDDITIGRNPDQFRPMINVIKGNTDESTLLTLTVIKNRVKFQA